MMTALFQTIITWLELTALAFCMAILVFQLPIFESRRAFAFHRHAPGSAITPVFMVSATVIAAATGAELAMKAAEMNGTGMHPGFPGFSAFLNETHSGFLLMLRMAALLVLALLMAGVKRTRDAHLFKYLMPVPGVILAWTFSASGHPSVRGYLGLPQIVDLIHLVAASLWGGGVFVLALIILPPLVRSGNIMIIADVSRMFTRVTGAAVAVVLLTALFNIKIYAGSFEALWNTAYGLTMLAKIILLYFLLLVGAFNRYVAVPMLQHVSGTRVDGPGLLGRVIGALFVGIRDYLGGPVTLLFRKALLIEAILMSALLICSSVLKHQDPPAFKKTKEQGQVEQSW